MRAARAWARVIVVGLLCAGRAEAQLGTQCGDCQRELMVCPPGPRPVDFLSLIQPIEVVDGPLTWVQSAGGLRAQFFALPLTEFCLDDVCGGGFRLASFAALDVGDVDDVPGFRCEVKCVADPTCGVQTICAPTRFDAFESPACGDNHPLCRQSPIRVPELPADRLPGGVTDQCQATRPQDFEQECEGPDPYQALEATIQVFGGIPFWQGFCNGYPGNPDECLDAKLCRVASDTNRCVRCTGRNDCYRAAADDPEDGVSVNDTRCEEGMSDPDCVALICIE